MKKIFLTLIFLIGLFVSCSKSDIQQINQQYVDVSFSYTLEQGSMYTKSDVFSDVFYNQITSKDLVAENYNITLTEITTGEKYSLQGNWKSNDMFTIKTGKYKVTGTSKAYGQYIQSKCSLKFDTEININSNDNVIIIPAEYNCFLLIFSKDNVSQVNCFYEGKVDGSYTYHSDDKFYSLDKYVYAFSNKLYKDDAKDPALMITLKSTYYNGSTYTNNSWFYTSTINFEIGKYYLYNPIDNNFSIPEMTQGII